MSLEEKAEKITKEYKYKSGLLSNFSLEFEPRKRGFAHVSTKYNRKTGEIIGTTMKINPRHLEILHRKDPQKTEIYLRYAVAHEIGHLKQIEEWGIKKTAKTPKFLTEKDADKRAFQLMGFPEIDIRKTIKKLENLF